MEERKENLAMYKINIAKTFGINCAIFLNALEYSDDKTEDGWVYITAEQIEEYTALTKRQQSYVRNQLMKLNILEIKIKGYPMKSFYKIDENILNDYINGNKTLPPRRNTSATKQNSNKNNNNAVTAESYDSKVSLLATKLIENIQKISNDVVTTESNHSDDTLFTEPSLPTTTETVFETASVQSDNNNPLYNTVTKKEENSDDEFFTTMIVKKKANDVYNFFTTYVEIWSQKYKDFNKPILTPKVAGIIKNILKIEKDKDKLYDALKAFISSNDSYIINRLHDLSLFLNDINKWIALSVNPELAKKFTQEYCKARLYEEAKEIAKKDFEKENNKRIQEKILEDIRKREGELNDNRRAV